MGRYKFQILIRAKRTTEFSLVVLLSIYHGIAFHHLNYFHPEVPAMHSVQ